MSNQTKEVVAEMARLTILSNKLNDIQMQNLKMYPFIFFDNINRITMDYDLSNTMDVSTEEDSKEVDISYEVVSKTQRMHVTYHLETETVVQQTHMKTRFSHLESSVHTLLWKEINVIVYMNGAKVFESNNEPK